MKRDKEWPRWTPLAVCGLIVCVFCFFAVIEALPASFKPAFRWGVGVDSAKLFITLVGGTHWDSTAGVARTNVANYDSTITGLSNDTGYLVICRIWDADSGKDWTFYWPVISSATATISDADIGKIADSTDSILSDHHSPDSWATGGAGSGTYTVDIYVFDTLGGSTTAVEGATVDWRLWDLGRPSHRVVTSNEFGIGQIATNSDSLAVRVEYNPFYIFSTAWDSMTWTTDYSDSIYGYRFFAGASPDPDLCRVYGWISIPTGGTDEKIKVTITNDGGVYNSCDSTAFINQPIIRWTKTHADSLGFFYADLIPSGCLLKSDGDSLQYKINAELDGNTIQEILTHIPQAESYRVW